MIPSERVGDSLMELMAHPDEPEWILDWVRRVRVCPSCKCMWAINIQCAEEHKGEPIRSVRFSCAGCGLEISLLEGPARPLSVDDVKLREMVKPSSGRNRARR